MREKLLYSTNVMFVLVSRITASLAVAPDRDPTNTAYDLLCYYHLPIDKDLVQMAIRVAREEIDGALEWKKEQKE